MNIFKVLASAKDTFRETQVSAMFAWLLNPYMEHGLEFVFLKKILNEIITDKTVFTELNDLLKPALRTNKLEERYSFNIDLELDPGDGHKIDIAIEIHKYMFAIENKIYSNSIQSEGNELKNQYGGLKEKYKDYKIFMVFLVPEKEINGVKKEDNNLVLNRAGDEKIIIEWETIRKIIHEILDEEQKGDVSPISDYVRQTLKAFSNFIKEGFKGYYYKSEKILSNPLSEGSKNYNAIKSDANISYVGIKNGIAGLFKEKNLRRKEFQYTSKKFKNGNGWKEVHF